MVIHTWVMSRDKMKNAKVKLFNERSFEMDMLHADLLTSLSFALAIFRSQYLCSKVSRYVKNQGSAIRVIFT